MIKKQYHLVVQEYMFLFSKSKLRDLWNFYNAVFNEKSEQLFFFRDSMHGLQLLLVKMIRHSINF